MGDNGVFLTSYRPARPVWVSKVRIQSETGNKADAKTRKPAGRTKIGNEDGERGGIMTNQQVRYGTKREEKWEVRQGGQDAGFRSDVERMRMYVSCHVDVMYGICMKGRERCIMSTRRGR